MGAPGAGPAPYAAPCRSGPRTPRHPTGPGSFRARAAGGADRARSRTAGSARIPSRWERRSGRDRRRARAGPGCPQGSRTRRACPWRRRGRPGAWGSRSGTGRRKRAHPGSRVRRGPRPAVPVRVNRWNPAPAAPGYAEAPRGGPRGRWAGQRLAGGARGRWGAPSRVSNPSVRCCAPCVQFVPQKSRYPECVPRERNHRVVRQPLRRVTVGHRREQPVRPSPDRTAVALVPLAHVLPPLGDVRSSPACAPGVVASRPPATRPPLLNDGAAHRP